MISWLNRCIYRIWIILRPLLPFMFANQLRGFCFYVMGNLLLDRKIHQKTSVPVSFVMKLQASFLIKGLRYRCFPGNFENFLRGRFCKTPLDNCFCFYTIYLEQKNCSYMVINSSVTEGAVFYQCSAITDSRKLQKRLGRLIKGWRPGLTSSHPKSLQKKKKKKKKSKNY